jgi:hypothetical protein
MWLDASACGLGASSFDTFRANVPVHLPCLLLRVRDLRANVPF